MNRHRASESILKDVIDGIRPYEDLPLLPEIPNSIEERYQWLKDQKVKSNKRRAPLEPVIKRVKICTECSVCKCSDYPVCITKNMCEPCENCTEKSIHMQLDRNGNGIKGTSDIVKESDDQVETDESEIDDHTESECEFSD